jgi:hypothetical protein
MPPRFSGVDIDTQRRYFDGKYSFAVVLNPNQKKWTVYCGPTAEECKGDLLVAEETFAQYSEPKITIQNARGDLALRQDGTVAHLNPDGSVLAPTGRTSATDGSSIMDWVGQRFENFGKWLKSPKQQVASQQPTMQSQNPTTRNDVPLTRNVTQSPPATQQSEQTRQPAPRITVQETVKPKITILPREGHGETRRVVDATVFVVSAGDTFRLLKQTEDGLQVIEQNIIEIVDTVICNSENTSRSLSNPINAHIDVNSDLTFEIRLCEEKDNTIIKVSRRPFEEVFLDSLIKIHVDDAARAINRTADSPRYLLYVSSTPVSIKLVAIQIKKEAIS